MVSIRPAITQTNIELRKLTIIISNIAQRGYWRSIIHLGLKFISSCRVTRISHIIILPTSTATQIFLINRDSKPPIYWLIRTPFRQHSPNNRHIVFPILSPEMQLGKGNT